MAYTRLNPASAEATITHGSAIKYGRVVTVNVNVSANDTTTTGYMSLGFLPQSMWPPMDSYAATARGDGSGSTGILNVKASNGEVRAYVPVAYKQYVGTVSYIV